MPQIQGSQFKDPHEYQIQKFQSKIIENDIEPIKNIYIDLRCLKDIQLGALLTYLHEDRDVEGYSYVLAEVEHYRKRMDNTIMRYFPLLSYTEKQIEDRILDPTYTDKIVALSPTTGCYENLHRIFYVIKRRNDHFDRQYPTRIIFNVYPFKLTPYIQKFLTDVVNTICPQFKVGFIQKPLKYLSTSSLTDNGKLDFKIFFIWDVWDTFLGEDSHLKGPFTEDMLFFNAQVYGSKKFQILPKEEEMEEGLHNLELLRGYLNICCEFEYADFEILASDQEE